MSESQAKNRQKRGPTRRGPGMTVSRVPHEIFKLIAERIAPNQAALLRFSMVCTGSRDAVLKDHQLWYRMLCDEQQAHFRSFKRSNVGPAVVRSIPMSPYPNFKTVEGLSEGGTSATPFLWQINRLSWPHLVSPAQTGEFTAAEMAAFAAHAVTCARLTHGSTCGVCGSRHRHFPVWGLGMRVCSPCMKDNLVSSAVLYVEHGVNYAEHCDALAGRVFYFRQSYSLVNMARNLTHNPVDFREQCRMYNVFFWLPHLRKVIDVDAAKLRHRDPARRAAANRIAAAARALVVRITIGQKGKTHSRFGNHHFYTRAPAQPKSAGGFHSAAPLADAEATLIDRNLPSSYSRRTLVSVEEDARRLLQRSFLAFRGDLRLLPRRSAEATLERLRIMEATRGERLIKPLPPSLYASTAEFRKWLDMRPTLLA